MLNNNTMSSLKRALYPHFYPIEGDFYPTSTSQESLAPVRRLCGFDRKVGAPSD